jgi:hypothetical protein
VNLDLPAILMQGGLDPSESDPRFHQQMVYAVALKTLENFDRALGRILRLGSHSRKRNTNYPRLRLFPHAFYGANAFYSTNLNAILFGYFKADAADVGPNLPGQTVFTCLSHDVIAHEMTHAIVESSNRVSCISSGSNTFFCIQSGKADSPTRWMIMLNRMYPVFE